MVLFHCSFVSLKFLSALSFELHPDEFKLAGERRLFQAYVSYQGPPAPQGTHCYKC